MEVSPSPFLSGETTDDSGEVKLTDLDDEVNLQHQISEKRRRVEELTATLAFETKALARLERLREVPTSVKKHSGRNERLGSLLSRRNFRLSSKLASLCGARVIATLSLVDTEIRDAIANSMATIDLTSVPRRYTFGEALHLSQRFRVIGMRVSLDLPASSGGGAGSTPVGGAVPPPLSTTLKTLDLSSCRSRWGGLVATYLAACGAVQRLNLDNSNAAGDVTELFGNKAQLRELSAVGCGTLAGDVITFASMPKLKLLDLRKCSGVAGDLAAFSLRSDSLQVLCLEDTGVTGNIDRLTKAGSVLKRLRLCGMGAAITGNLASLGAKCLQLKELHLSGTHVKGQLSDLKALTKLESLCLESQDNKLNGDISNLQSLPLLRELRLHGTRVFGDVASLKSLIKLTELRLHNTMVQGELWAGLGDLLDLTVVTLPHQKFCEQTSALETLKLNRPNCNVLLIPSKP